MKHITLLLALLLAGGSGACAAPGSTNAAAMAAQLLIDSSSMPIAAGRATLSIGTLQGTNGVYSGDYRISVAPYFFKNDKGRLAIVVPDEALARLDQGKVVAIIGTATSTRKGGKSRHIEATATPADLHHGKLRLWFMAGDRKMIFEPEYHIAGTGTAAVPAAPTETNLASNSQSSLAASHREAAESRAKIP